MTCSCLAEICSMTCSCLAEICSFFALFLRLDGRHLLFVGGLPLVFVPEIFGDLLVFEPLPLLLLSPRIGDLLVRPLDLLQQLAALQLPQSLLPLLFLLSFSP